MISTLSSHGTTWATASLRTPGSSESKPSLTHNNEGLDQFSMQTPKPRFAGVDDTDLDAQMEQARSVQINRNSTESLKTVALAEEKRLIQAKAEAATANAQEESQQQEQAQAKLALEQQEQNQLRQNQERQQEEAAQQATEKQAQQEQIRLEQEKLAQAKLVQEKQNLARQEQERQEQAQRTAAMAQVAATNANPSGLPVTTGY